MAKLEKSRETPQPGGPYKKNSHHWVDAWCRMTVKEYDAVMKKLAIMVADFALESQVSDLT
jgi:hypothetical protein